MRRSVQSSTRQISPKQGVVLLSQRTKTHQSTHCCVLCIARPTYAEQTPPAHMYSLSGGSFEPQLLNTPVTLCQATELSKPFGCAILGVSACVGRRYTRFRQRSARLHSPRWCPAAAELVRRGNARSYGAREYRRLALVSSALLRTGSAARRSCRQSDAKQCALRNRIGF